MSNNGQSTVPWMDLAKLCQQSVENRKGIEWKVAFGFWSGIGGFTWFVLQTPNRRSDLLDNYLGWVYLAAFLVWLFFWQLPLHRAMEIDKQWKHYYMGKAETADATRPTAGRCKCSDYWWGLLNPWLLGQVLMTGVFLVLSYMLLQSRQAS